jgi:DNA-binding NarL/FixJ family response regulator
MGLRTALDIIEHITVVDEAASGTEAVRMVRRHRPDVVLMDLNMPELTGVEAIKEIRRDCPKTTILVLTVHTDDETLMAAMRAGAQGYLFKGSTAPEIAMAIEGISRGEAVFGAPVANRIIDHIVNPPEQKAPFPELTERELAILERVADGRSNVQIATDLGLAGKTVRNYMSRIFTKLQVTDRTAAAVRARQAGLGR